MVQVVSDAQETYETPERLCPAAPNGPPRPNAPRTTRVFRLKPPARDSALRCAFTRTAQGGTLSNPYTISPLPDPQPAASPRPLRKMKRVYVGGVLIMLVGFGCGSADGPERDRAAAVGAKPRPGPTVTETVTAKPLAKSLAGPTATATVTAAPRPRVTITEPGPTVAVTETETAEVYDAGSGGSWGSGGSDDEGSDVYYENCSAARAAGAAPVHRGAPGYGSHLDRDNDGTGCDWG